MYRNGFIFYLGAVILGIYMGKTYPQPKAEPACQEAQQQGGQ